MTYVKYVGQREVGKGRVGLLASGELAIFLVFLDSKIQIFGSVAVFDQSDFTYAVLALCKGVEVVRFEERESTAMVLCDPVACGVIHSDYGTCLKIPDGERTMVSFTLKVSHRAGPHVVDGGVRDEFLYGDLAVV